MRSLNILFLSSFAKRNPNEVAFCKIWDVADDLFFVCDSKLGTSFSRRRKGFKLFKDPETGNRLVGSKNFRVYLKILGEVPDITCVGACRFDKNQSKALVA